MFRVLRVLDLIGRIAIPGYPDLSIHGSSYARLYIGGSELLLVQLDRTYYLDRISSWCDRAGYFTKRLAYHLLFCGGLQLHALGGSNRVGYLFLDQGGEFE